MSMPIDPKAKAYMLYLRGTGMNNQQIAKQIGCGKATVQRYIGRSPFENPGRRAGWRIPDHIPGMEPVAEQEVKPVAEPEAEQERKPNGYVKISDLKDLMLFLRGTGLSYVDIANKIGCSDWTVRKYISSEWNKKSEPDPKIVVTRTRITYRKAN